MFSTGFFRAHNLRRVACARPIEQNFLNLATAYAMATSLVAQDFHFSISNWNVLGSS